MCLCNVLLFWLVILTDWPFSCLCNKYEATPYKDRVKRANIYAGSGNTIQSCGFIMHYGLTVSCPNAVILEVLSSKKNSLAFYFINRHENSTSLLYLDKNKHYFIKS